MPNKLKKGDLFLVTEKPYLFDEKKYSKEWPEEAEDNFYTKMIEENNLEYCIELPKRLWLCGPTRIYATKEISEEEAYKWYEISIYYQEGPNSSNANATSLIESKGTHLYKVRNPNKQLIY